MFVGNFFGHFWDNFLLMFSQENASPVSMKTQERRAPTPRTFRAHSPGRTARF